MCNKTSGATEKEKEDTVNDAIARLDVIYKEVLENIEKAQEKQKESYNKNVNKYKMEEQNNEISVREELYLYNTSQK